LTGGKSHVTEPSNASRTLAFHLTKHRFDEKLSRILGVPLKLWPEVRSSMGEFGKTLGVPGLPDGIPITGILGDQQSALLGQACTEPGQAKCTYGTGAFLLMNTGKKPIYSKHRLLTTIAWARGKDVTYALEGSIFIAGAAVQWLRDEVGFIQNASDVEKLAASVEDSGGVVFVPALTGMGAPYWDPEARGMLCGLTRGSGRPQIARAVLEGIAFQIRDLLTAMEKDLGKKLKSLNVDGGASANRLLMQFQADLLGVPLKRPQYVETTSLGAIFAAGLGAGIWKNFKEIEKTWKMDRVFNSEISPKQRALTLKRWTAAVARTMLHPQ
jgi:glycerol kinase